MLIFLRGAELACGRYWRHGKPCPVRSSRNFWKWWPIVGAAGLWRQPWL